jgi:hypothetical protein
MMGNRSRNEDGQIFPLVLVAAVGVLAIGFALFQVGRGTDLKARSQTGADAAALAGAQALGTELTGVLSAAYRPVPVPTPRPTATPLPGAPPLPPAPPVVVPPPVLDLTQIRASVINGAAADYASRNDTDLLDLQFDVATLTVRANVQTRGALTGIGGGAHGTAEARAQLVLGGTCLPASTSALGLPLPACATGQLPDLAGLRARVRLVP